MLEFNSQLPLGTLLQQKTLSSSEKTESLIQNWLLYDNIGFSELQLGDVIALTECLQTEKTADNWQNLAATIKNKQRILAEWNNTLTFARMKSSVTSI